MVMKSKTTAGASNLLEKTRNDPVKLNQDIQNISGATLSAKHVTDGVKRVLAIYDLVLSKE